MIQDVPCSVLGIKLRGLTFGTTPPTVKGGDRGQPPPRHGLRFGSPDSLNAICRALLFLAARSGCQRDERNPGLAARTRDARRDDRRNGAYDASSPPPALIAGQGPRLVVKYYLSQQIQPEV